MNKRIVVVGAGPGGLTAAMLLAARGYQVQVFEKAAQLGGRNGALRVGEYVFETGPTFLIMPGILEEMFQLAGRKVSDYLDIRPLEPMYRLDFGDGRRLEPSRNPTKMRDEIERLFPGEGSGFDRYLAREKEKFDRLLPCLRVPYLRLRNYLSPRMRRALLYLDAHLSLFGELGKYFRHPMLRLAFTFQAKYLGMSPWKCPGTFSIISYLEHFAGIHHPIGGLHKISQTMGKIVEEYGGKIYTSTPVQQVTVRQGRAVGVQLATGEQISADAVVVNADIGHAICHLFPRSALRKWTPEKLAKKKFSCSTFMLYLGLDCRYDHLPHHTIFFASDYRRNVDEIAQKLVLSDDPSFYVQNASVTDPTLAPPGHSTIYVLVPVPNNRSGIDWEQQRAVYRDLIIGLLESRAGLSDLQRHIRAERIITPWDWEQRANVYIGATFNLAHSVDQMLYFRPHNRFDDIEDCYLVGGGTHPGSGLPTIYESGRIAADLISQHHPR